jgi:hypothetical protein
VKRFSGWLAAVGEIRPGSGHRPVRMAGTASTVAGATVVWFRYQVESSARRAKFGNRRRSTFPSASTSEPSASSSRRIMTTGAGFVARTSYRG